MKIIVYSAIVTCLLSPVKAIDKIRHYFVDPVGGGGPTLHPGNRCGSSIGSVVDRTRTSGADVATKIIRIAVFQMNDEALLNKLQEAALAGVSIYILADSSQGPALTTLKQKVNQYNRTNVAAAGYVRMKLKVRTGLGTYGKMHRKILYARYGGTEHVILGSYNFTNNAAKHSFENCVRFAHLAAADVAADDALDPAIAGADADLAIVPHLIGEIRADHEMRFAHAASLFPTDPHMDFGQDVVPDLPPPALTDEERSRRLRRDITIHMLEQKRTKAGRLSDDDDRRLRRLHRDKASD